MIKLKNIFSSLLFCLTIISCRQTNAKQQIEQNDLQKKVESSNDTIDNRNFKADSKVETLTLIYNAISCTCAQWSETRKSEDTNRKQNYWLEPANEKLLNAHTVFNGENLPVIIKVTGQVITENGFPKRKLAKIGQGEAGRVFRYTKIEVPQNGQQKNSR